MSRRSILSLVTIAAVAFIAPTGAFAKTIETDAQSFLRKAAEGQQVEISLGELAIHRAKNERVKEFGHQMVEDHKKASRQVEQLAMKQGIQLPPGLNPGHRQKVNELS